MSHPISYTALCTLLGLGLGWAPLLLHGPIPQKFDVLYVNGTVAVWSFYWARLSIGFLVGVSVWPARWWIRGPLIGGIAMASPAIMAVAVPGCRYACMAWNLSTAIAVGTVVAGIARLVTGRDHG